MRPKFQLGQTLATPGALQAIETAGQSPAFFLDRHVQGDWGGAPDVSGFAQQDGQVRETLMAMLQDRGRLVGHRT
jgi:hypothetical protein